MRNRAYLWLGGDLHVFFGRFSTPVDIQPAVQTLFYTVDQAIDCEFDGDRISSNFIGVRAGKRAIVDAKNQYVLTIFHDAGLSGRVDLDATLNYQVSQTHSDIITADRIELASLLDEWYRIFDRAGRQFPTASLTDMRQQYLDLLAWKETQDPRIIQAIRFMDEHFFERYHVEDVAREVNLSNSRFSELFKQHLGVPLRTLRLWMRIKHAVELVSEDTPAAIASVESGFTDYPQFSRVFKQMVGASPCVLSTHFNDLAIEKQAS